MARPRSVTAQSKVLRKHAQDAARRIVARVPCSIALTGSAARGDSEEGSDIDLWVVGPPPSRETFEDRGRAVTLICQPLRTALTFRNLCYWEVRDLLVLEDQRGAFEKIRARFNELAPRIDAAVLSATFDAVDEALSAAQSDDPLEQLRGVRAAAHRIAAAQVFRLTKQRVPRVRQLRRYLPPKAFAAYSKAMGFAKAEKLTRAALRAWPKLGYPVEAGYPLEEAREKLQAGRSSDALLIARRHFDLGATSSGARPRPEVYAYGELIHDVNERTAREVFAAFEALTHALDVRAWAPPRTIRKLERCFSSRRPRRAS